MMPRLPSAARAAAFLLLLLAALPPGGSGAQQKSTAGSPSAVEWNCIKQTISAQVNALKAGDAAKAFSFASPVIRDQFGTPAHFLEMVRGGYGALIAARYTEFLEGAVIEGRIVQPLRLIAPDNTVLVALYTMEKQRDGVWKIAGCVLAPSSVQAA